MKSPLNILNNHFFKNANIQIILSKEPDYETMTKSSSRPCCVRDYHVYRKATWEIAGLQLEPIYLENTTQ